MLYKDLRPGHCFVTDGGELFMVISARVMGPADSSHGRVTAVPVGWLRLDYLISSPRGKRLRLWTDYRWPADALSVAWRALTGEILGRTGVGWGHVRPHTRPRRAN